MRVKMSSTASPFHLKISTYTKSGTLEWRINGGSGIKSGWGCVENQRFNRPKTKNYITEGKIIPRKLIIGRAIIRYSRVRR